MNIFPERADFSDNISALLAVLAALYFSYIPLVFVTNALGIAKWIGFIAVLSLSMFFTLVWLPKPNFLISKHVLITILLYVPFLIYAANSFVWHINYLNDYQTVVVITLINPIMIFLALMNSNNKSFMLKTILVMSAIYFVFVLRAAIFGSLLTTNDFTQVFSFVSGAEYQNINIYLGLFLILLWNVRLFQNLAWLLVRFILTPLILLLMLAVGGRASIISACFVLLLMLWFSRLGIGRKIIIICGIVGAALIVLLNLHAFFPNVELLGFRRFEVLLGGDDSSERIYLFSHAWNLFMLNAQNILFGAGMNYFPVYIGKMATGWYPHNLILELLSEYGVFGLFLFIMPIYYLLHMRKKVLGSIIGDTQDERGSFFLFLFLLIEAMFTGGLFYSWMLIFFIFLAFPGIQKRGLLHRGPLIQYAPNESRRSTIMVSSL